MCVNGVCAAAVINSSISNLAEVCNIAKPLMEAISHKEVCLNL